MATKGHRKTWAPEFPKEQVIFPKKNEGCKNGGCEVRTRANNRSTDLKSAALDLSANPPIYSFCDIVTKCYDIDFGSCDHIGSGWCSKCSYDVIMFGGPLGGAPSIGVLCSVYKARCCRSSDLGKKQVSLRRNRTKATQQDLDNHILLYKTNGIDYVPHF